jgi:hypothetical protein
MAFWMFLEIRAPSHQQKKFPPTSNLRGLQDIPQDWSWPIIKKTALRRISD